MPDDNRIAAAITAAVKAQILTKLQEILDLVPFVVNLTPDDKQSIPTIGLNRAGMIPIFIQQMKAHPELVPSYVNMPALDEDNALYFDLGELLSGGLVVTEALGDTKHLAGADMLLAFLAYYNNLKEAARRNVPGADSLLAALAPFFARSPRPPGPTTPPGPGP